MTEDRLAQFRRNPGAQAPGATPPAGGKEAYEAFGSKDNQRRNRIDIRLKNGFAHAIAYSYIIEVVYDRRQGSEILIVASTVLVKIRGRNLRAVSDALLLGSCQYVQEFSVDHFEAPADSAAPFIDTIEVVSASSLRENRSKKE